jgi:Fic family protein
MYNWEYKNWPNFKYNLDGLENKLLEINATVNHVVGAVSSLPDELQTETIVQVMVAEALKTAEIEGEFFSRIDVMSSIKKNLGLSTDKSPSNKNTIGLGKMLMDARNTFNEPLSEKKLLHWHALLMSNNKKINAGVYRRGEEPMQIISGSVSDPTVHFEGPPSSRVPDEMAQFIAWFNQDKPNKKDWRLNAPPVKAAIAHLYFESIHPFEDGNGRIGRVIAEKALSKGFGRPLFLSLSKTIEKNRKEYYNELKEAQRKLDITQWINWFINIVSKAQGETNQLVTFTIKKMHFFDRFKNQLNERQTKVINRMLEEGPDPFVGGINAKKYMGITGCSKATATRDLQDLKATGAINMMESAGRSTSYTINM